MPHIVTRRVALAAAFFAGIGIASSAFAQSPSSNPLPSWNDGAAKGAITDFVGRVTHETGPDFVPAPERIATFDNDGTLWAEQPIYVQFAFMIDRVRALASKHPDWKRRQPFKTVLDGDHKALAALDARELLTLMAATHTNMTTDDFTTAVSDWIATARHPRFDRPYTDLVYQPMVELLRYLRANGFKTFIVSGGGVEFMRPWAERAYGIPPEQVVGSSGDDGPGKPVGINRFIGRRPIFAFGNSDGDQQMLQWTADSSGARFMGLVHHTDVEREWAYDRQSHVGKLDRALDEAKTRGWTVVDMKRDWRTVFRFEDATVGTR